MLQFEEQTYCAEEEWIKNWLKVSIDSVVPTSQGTVHNYSSPSEKIALFRSLFRGRDDVYPSKMPLR
jgi:hypothetical protein